MIDPSIEEIINEFGFERRETYGFFENGEFKKIKFYSFLTNKTFFSNLNKVKELGNYKILYITYDKKYNLVITENEKMFNRFKEAIILINKEEKLLKVSMEVRAEKKEINLEKESKGNKIIST